MAKVCTVCHARKRLLTTAGMSANLVKADCDRDSEDLRPQATSAATPMLVKVEDKLVQPDALVRRVLVSNGAAGLFPGGLVADKCDSRGVSGSHRE